MNLRERFLKETGISPYVTGNSYQYYVKEYVDWLESSLSHPVTENELSASEQNKRMRVWFEERTGLKDELLSMHMKVIDEILTTKPHPVTEMVTDAMLEEEAAKRYFDEDYPSRYCEAFEDGGKYVRDRLTQPKTEWISVKDRLPEHPGFIIAHKTNGLVVGLHYNMSNKFTYGQLDQTSQVTHWMPLPQPPK